jgi:predicted NBD/HSP70 family sugar kinase
VAALLRSSGGLTRAGIASRLRLSRATVSGALAGLIRDGLAAERDDDSSTPGRGRPPSQVALTRAAGVAIGVDLGRRHLRVAVADLGHHLLAERHERFDSDGRPDAALDEIPTLIEAAAADAGVRLTDAVGLVLGLPAPVDARGQLGNNSVLPGWAGHRPAQELAQRLRVPVVAENDANLGALAESVWGTGRGHGDLLYLKAATGIGAGIVLDGRLFRGTGGAAGEIGHTTVSDGGAVCRCGNRGCLELLAGGPALVAQLAQGGVHVDGLPDILARAAQGDPSCRRVLADAGDHIGLAVANAVNLLNPELVVVGGDLGTAGELVLGPLRARVSRSAMPPAAQVVRVTAGTLGDRAEVLGAVLLVLRDADRFADQPIRAGRRTARRAAPRRSGAPTR